MSKVIKLGNYKEIEVNVKDNLSHKKKLIAKLIVY